MPVDRFRGAERLLQKKRISTEERGRGESADNQICTFYPNFWPNFRRKGWHVWIVIELRPNAMTSRSIWNSNFEPPYEHRLRSPLPAGICLLSYYWPKTILDALWPGLFGCSQGTITRFDYHWWFTSNWTCQLDVLFKQQEIVTKCSSQWTVHFDQKSSSWSFRSVRLGVADSITSASGFWIKLISNDLRMCWREPHTEQRQEI